MNEPLRPVVSEIVIVVVPLVVVIFAVSVRPVLITGFGAAAVGKMPI